MQCERTHVRPVAVRYIMRGGVRVASSADMLRCVQWCVISAQLGFYIGGYTGLQGFILYMFLCDSAGFLSNVADLESFQIKSAFKHTIIRNITNTYLLRQQTTRIANRVYYTCQSWRSRHQEQEKSKFCQIEVLSSSKLHIMWTSHHEVKYMWVYHNIINNFKLKKNTLWGRIQDGGIRGQTLCWSTAAGRAK